MLCKKPYMIGVMPCGCGQCLPCRINRRRMWTHRMLLESFMHSDSIFTTVTYSDECLPELGSLVPRDPQLWIKKVRERIAPRKLRYYLVGEYGEESGRPHYHAALFGISFMERDLVDDCWGKGICYSGELNKASASYIAGYVTKKLTKADDPRLKGRHPEFARMSRHPGIGAHAMNVVARALSSAEGQKLVESSGDVPYLLQHGVSKMGLGRYLRRKLREKIGKPADAPEGALASYGKELRGMFEIEIKDPKNKDKNLKEIFVDLNCQKVLNMESRHKIYSAKGKI